MQDDVSGHVWREQVANRRPLRQAAHELGQLVAHDHDQAETEYYEAAADTDAQALDNAQRSYAGQYRRRLRRLHERNRRPKPDDTG